MESFNAKHDNKFKIRWDNKTGTPKSIRKHRITGYAGSPLEIATQFLKDEKGMLGIDSVSQDLELKDIREMRTGATRVHFTQKYEDIKVLNTGYLVIMDADGGIFKVSGDYYPDINLVSVIPSQSAEAVKAVIQSDIKDGTIESMSDPDLGILPQIKDTTETYTLVYQATALASNPPVHWEYTIDANTGDIINKNSLWCDITGTGRVYLTDPDDCSYSNEYLYRLDNVYPRLLKGSNVEVYNYDTSEAYSWGTSFVYLPTNTHFDEVMCYYHVDMFETFLINLGMSGSQLGEMTVHVHDPNYYASSFYTTRVLRFDDQNSNPDLLNPTKDASVIAHETMHCVTWTYCDMDDNLEEDSMNEAISDYFGVAYWNENSSNSTSWIGSYIDDDTNYNIARNLDNNYHYDDFGEIEWDQFPGSYEHDNGLIYSGALWDFRTDPQTNADNVNDIIMASLDYLDDVVDFEEGREAIEDAADDMDYDSYLDDIAEAFYAHGIGDPPPVSVYISGVTSLDFKETSTWTANASDGQTPYSYQWYNRYEGEGPSWNTIISGTTSTHFQMMGTRDFELKVVVTDNVSDTDEDTHYVYYADGGEPKLIGSGYEPIPTVYSLNQNYPNPFNPETKIRFGLPSDSNVKLEIFNIQGQLVATLIEAALAAGYHTVTLDGEFLPSGVYFYKIVAGEFTDIKRMLLIK